MSPKELSRAVALPARPLPSQDAFFRLPVAPASAPRRRAAGQQAWPPRQRPTPPRSPDTTGPPRISPPPAPGSVRPRQRDIPSLQDAVVGSASGATLNCARITLRNINVASMRCREAAQDPAGAPQVVHAPQATCPTCNTTPSRPPGSSVSAGSAAGPGRPAQAPGRISPRWARRRRAPRRRSTPRKRAADAFRAAPPVRSRPPRRPSRARSAASAHATRLSHPTGQAGLASCRSRTAPPAALKAPPAPPRALLPLALDQAPQVAAVAVSLSR